MTDRTVDLEAAIRAQHELIASAQGLLTRCLVKEIESPALVDYLLMLFDGPRQRETQQLEARRWGAARSGAEEIRIHNRHPCNKTVNR